MLNKWIDTGEVIVFLEYSFIPLSKPTIQLSTLFLSLNYAFQKCTLLLFLSRS